MLLVDVGNTRVKWARLDGDTLGPQSAAAHAGWSARDWHAALFDGAPVSAVLAGSVAGEEVNSALEAATREATGRGVRFVASSPEAAGVRSGYADPALLGVDRWLAVIGACALIRGARVVVDVGTAATVDLVDADGRHRGGYIVPGPSLMSRSLRRSTADLAQRHAASGPASLTDGPADNTRDAIERGACLAVAALVDRCVADATVAGRRPKLLLTGGDAAEVLPWLRTPAEVVPDLVLRGLREFVRQGVPTEPAPGDTK